MYVKVRYTGLVSGNGPNQKGQYMNEALGKPKGRLAIKGSEFYLSETTAKSYFASYPSMLEIVDDSTKIARKANVISRLSLVIAIGGLVTAIIISG